MFSNPGKKIMTVAKVLFWIGAVLSALYCAMIVLVSVAGFQGLNGSGLTVPAASTPVAGIVAAVLTLVIGVAGSWIASLILYGFGKMIENSETVAASMRPARPVIQAPQLKQTGK